MSKIRQYLKDYYYFSRTQRNAIIFLGGLIILIISAWFSFPLFLKNESNHPDLGFIKQAKEFESSKVVAPSSGTNLSHFDPNVLDKEGFIAMGLADRTSSNIVNYRKAGGKFRTKEDLKKVYSINDSLYQILEPYIIIQPEPDEGKSFDNEKIPEIILFPFDPNSLDDESWKKLGFSDFKILNIRNYSKAGGKFVVKEDLKKLHTIRKDDYERVKDFILLPDSLTRKMNNEQNKVSYEKTAFPMVEINGADTAQLSKLKGVGQAISQRIFNYREKLGGFFRKEQMMEVFGIDTMRYKGFENQVLVDVSLVRKMDINKTDFKEMTKHPYLEFHIVKSIFNYKDSKGSFESVDELRQVDLIYDHLYEKIRWYFYVNEKVK